MWFVTNILFFNLWIVLCNCYNIEVEKFVRHTVGQIDSMFGFSVALHKERGRSWVLVGAPEMQTSQRGVYKGGEVFYCDVNRDNLCYELPFDQAGNKYDRSNNQLDSKSGQWFGATVRSSGEDGIVMACAPRYVYFGGNHTLKEPVGTCFVAQNEFRNITEHAPCRIRLGSGYHKQGYCQAGFSASISKDSRRLYLGAVGSWYWQGQIFSNDKDLKISGFDPPIYYFLLTEDATGQIISRGLEQQDTIATKEGSKKEDDSYIGYSVASIEYYGIGVSGAAVGMPRGASLMGKVLLYTWNTTNLYNVTGDQMGAYFGYSIAVADVDGDGADDLIVGAPLYSNWDNNDKNYETGRVHVIYQGTGDDRFTRGDVLDGEATRGRFGLSLTSLGDINKDGFDDFAVGAPYEETDCPPAHLFCGHTAKYQGAVYIFHGSKQGVKKSPSQVIHAEDISKDKLTTFGFSLAGGLDLDNNLYPDLAIGAYESNAAYIMRARPVVKLGSTVKFLSDLVSLEDLKCTLMNGNSVPCLELEVCLKYTGVGVSNQIEVRKRLILDSRSRKDTRMYFRDQEKVSEIVEHVVLRKDIPTCSIAYTYVKTDIRDKLTPIEAEVHLSLEGYRQSTEELTPVLDTEGGKSFIAKGHINIRRHCGNDNICIPDLRLITKMANEEYKQGSNKRLVMEVTVINSGEDSFESVFTMVLPDGMNYVKLERLDEEKYITVHCNGSTLENNNTLKCDVGNPLPKGKTIHFNVILEPYYQESGHMQPRYDFIMSVNSTNLEIPNTITDNYSKITIPITVETELSITGGSRPRDVHYNNTYYDSKFITKETEAGPPVEHTYTIQNKGPADVERAEVVFLWPSYTLSGKDLLYLLYQPDIEGNIKCAYAKNVNPKNLKFDRQKSQASKVTGQFSASHATSYGSGYTSTGGSSHAGSVEYSSQGKVQTDTKDRTFSEHSSGGRYYETQEKSKINSSTTGFFSGQSGSTHHGNVEYGQGVGGYSQGTGYSYGSSGSAQETGGYSQGHGQSFVSGSGGILTGVQGVGGYSQGTGRSSVDSSYGSRTTVQGAGGSSWNPTASTSYGKERFGQDSSKTFFEEHSSSSGTYGSVGSDGQMYGGSRQGSQGNHDYSYNYNPDFQNFTTVHESEKRVVKNITYDDSGRPIVYNEETWRINDDGVVKNGSSFSTNKGDQYESYPRSSTHFFARDSDTNSQKNEQNYNLYGNTGGAKTYGISEGGKTSVIKVGEDLETVSRFKSELTRNVIPSGTKMFQQYPSPPLLHNKPVNVNINEEKVEQKPSLSEVYNRKDDDEEINDENNEEYDENEEGEDDQHENHGDDIEEEDPEIEPKQRRKREVKQTDNIDGPLNCGTTTCTAVRCSIGRLRKDQEVTVTFRALVWIQTLQELAYNREVQIGSMAIARITSLPHVGVPSVNTTKTYEVITNVKSLDVPVAPSVVPLWVVVLSACVGAIILMLLIWLLYKCGFFKRNRPSSAPERQPLNSNGQYHVGDEAL